MMMMDPDTVNSHKKYYAGLAPESLKPTNLSRGSVLSTVDCSLPVLVIAAHLCNALN